MSFLSGRANDRTAILSPRSKETLFIYASTNGVSKEQRGGKIGGEEGSSMLEKRVDYLHCNSVPGLLCTLSGRRIGGNLHLFAGS